MTVRTTRVCNLLVLHHYNPTASNYWAPAATQRNRAAAAPPGQGNPGCFRCLLCMPRCRSRPLWCKICLPRTPGAEGGVSAVGSHDSAKRRRRKPDINCCHHPALTWTAGLCGPWEASRVPDNVRKPGFHPTTGMLSGMNTPKEAGGIPEGWCSHCLGLLRIAALGRLGRESPLTAKPLTE